MRNTRDSIVLRIPFLLLILFCFATVFPKPLFAGNNTNKDLSRRKDDSLNVFHRRNIRLNQVGYRPQDSRKYAFVAGKTGAFDVLNVKNGSVAYSGTLVKIMDNAPAGKMTVRGAFNSITDLYNFTSGGGTETLYLANFSTVNKDGQYQVKIGNDTSAVFHINGRVYNYILETALNFFGSNRCGNTDSWMHEPCHLKDGSALGSGFDGALSGGWHDCGDHGKYAETQAYAALILALTYAIFPHKAEDLFGPSYEITVPDGIPDILYEAKIGVDYIYKLYKASRAKGLITSADMYHSVGDFDDHNYWDVPENQEAQPVSKGGPPRPVHTGVGSNVSGMFCAAMAIFSSGWRVFDAAYADSLQKAAIDIYDNVVMKKLNSGTSNIPGYTGGGRKDDDEAMAALALWFVTKQERFGYDLYKNKSIEDNPNHVYVPGQFPAGHMGSNRYFHHGGWTTDYEQIHIFALYAFAKLILKDVSTAGQYGVSAAERDTLLFDIKECMKLSIKTGSNGSNSALFPGINVDVPYHGVFTSADWGFNRYNMGLVNELFVYWDLTGGKDYFSVGIDNLNYNMGLNPWDMSFIMDVGDRNLQHPHNRAANPDGYNAGGFPYDYTSPRGALMGGAKPDKELLDDWEDYTATETCIDFSTQLILPAMILSTNSIIDTSDLWFFNVKVEQVGTNYAIISWETNKSSKDVLKYALQVGGTIIDVVDAGNYALKKVVRIDGLLPNTTYYFYLEGTDLFGNKGVGDNNGLWYKFTTLGNDTTNAIISDVRVCNITHDQATVYWWTKNGNFDSRVEYGKTTSLGSLKTGDDSGSPVVMFHAVTLTNLEPNTAYYFDVMSGNTRDDNKGKHYSFSTTEVLVNYDIRIKPTKKGGGSSGRAHFYIDLTNRESQPYTGLEIRFYFQLPEPEATQVIVRSNDKAIFDVGGMAQPLDLTINDPVRMTTPGYENYWYVAFIINSELPVAGRARIECDFYKREWDNLPFSKLADAWSIIPHTVPVPFTGVDLTKGDMYVGPDFVETVNGVPEVTYVKTHYITAYYKGVHVYGYPPDYKDNIPNSYKTVVLHFIEPFESPVSYLLQDSLDVTFAGRTWAFPNGNITNLEKNGKAVSFSPISGHKDSMSFTDHTTGLTLGPNPFTWVAWHNKEEADCACDQKRVTIEVDTGGVVVPPPVVSNAAYYDNNGDGFVDSVAITYTDTLGKLPEKVALFWPDTAGEEKTIVTGNTGMALLPNRRTVTIAINPPFTAVQTFGDGAGQSWHEFVPGKQDSVPQFSIADSVGPRLLKAFLFERFVGGQDTITLEVSEDVVASAITQAAGVSFVLVKQGGTEVDLTIVGSAGTGNQSNIIIALPDLGTSSPVAGDSILIYAKGPVTDVIGNKAHVKNPPVPLQLKSKPIPIDSADYWDSNADGIVENVKIYLKKKVSVSTIDKVAVTWTVDNDAATVGPSEISYASSDSTTIQLQLTDAFSNAILKKHGTGGGMTAGIYFNGVSNAETSVVTDKAAPVLIDSAWHFPGKLTSDSEREADTLRVTFSESVEGNSNTEPFNLLCLQTQTPYRVLLQPGIFFGANASVIVDTIIGKQYPSNNDSVWINILTAISDGFSNTQTNEQNRRVPIVVKPRPYNLVIKAVTPVNPKMFPFPPKVIGRLVKPVPFSKGVYLRVDPQTESSGNDEPLFTGATVQVLDAVGNLVASCDRIGKEYGILVIRRDRVNERLHIFWSGQNTNKRYVGTGVYIILMEIIDKDGVKIDKNIFIGIDESS